MRVIFRTELHKHSTQRITALAIAILALAMAKAAVDHLPFIASAPPIALGDRAAEAAVTDSRGVRYELPPVGRRASQPEILRLVDRITREGFDARAARHQVQVLFPRQRLLWPVDIADAVLMTLFFFVSFLVVPNVWRMVRSRLQRLHRASTLLAMAAMFTSLGPAYICYENVVPPLLGDAAYLFDWLALALEIVVLAGASFLIYRNLNVLTASTHSRQHRERAHPWASQDSDAKGWSRSQYGSRTARQFPA